MTSSPELPVPDAAVDAFTATDPMAYGDTEAMVRAIAGPVVAAVLRQLVAQADEDRGSGGAAYDDGFFDGANTVRDSAEKLADALDDR